MVKRLAAITRIALGRADGCSARRTRRSALRPAGLPASRHRSRWSATSTWLHRRCSQDNTFRFFPADQRVPRSVRKRCSVNWTVPRHSRLTKHGSSVVGSEDIPMLRKKSLGRAELGIRVRKHPSLPDRICKHHKTKDLRRIARNQAKRLGDAGEMVAALPMGRQGAQDTVQS